MKHIILGIILGILSGCMSVPTVEDSGDKGVLPIIVDAGIDTDFDAVCEEPVEDPEDQLLKMKEEVVKFWNEIFDELEVKKSDKRRGLFDMYAESLVNKTITLQNLDKLPKDPYTHLIIAYKTYSESSIRNIISKNRLREVGLLQVTGKALQGHTRKEVLNNVELGLSLGIDWLATTIQECGLSLDNWSIDKWAGPLALYTVGPNKALQKGQCNTKLRVTKRIINETKRISAKVLAK